MNATTPLKTSAIAAARDFQDLPAWQKSMTLAEQVYVKTERFPLREHVGLAAAMRASAQSIASQIASASARPDEKGVAENYGNAQQAISALFTQATLAARLGHLSTDDAVTMLGDIEEVERLLIGMRHGLKVQAKTEARAEREDAQRTREIEAKAAREERPRDGERPYRKPADSGRGEYRKRDEGSSERSERAPRGDKPYGERKPRSDKPYGERKSYGDKPYGEKKAYGDKKPYGEKKAYGDKKPYGDKPYGDKKPFRKGPPRNRD